MTLLAKWIDKKIKDKYIHYFEYNEFSNIVEIGRGTFGRVYKAELANTGLVALKSFVDEYSNIEEDELKRIDEEFVNELELLHEVDCHQNVNHILGITKVYRSYILVLEYANEGNLRDYLINKFTSLEWKDKIQMALDITCGLKFLHSKGIIHRDLHSKNILVNNGKLSIADLGLSKKLAEAATNSIANKMGIIEYIEPQCIKSDKYKKNKKSDIYSLGVLLWEISSGKCPFSDRSRDILAYHISYNNLREKPIGGTPQKYQQLYQECWDSEPELRPDIEKVYETLSQLKTEDFSSLPYSQSNINEIKNSNIDYNDDLNDLNISDIVNSRRESSHKPNFRDEALKYFDDCK
ncbi:Bck1p [Rhizophagus irregularis DAOM 197198w]|uniref:Bck1p n=1 Tax=Rhizophagus irregularis (strain DAOM 197198w) TaxID=1432141 RepID=A0A015JXJ6_RHIIW|nr:Bck1p [Rhizophagus irregularis DAOM 197198w]